MANANTDTIEYQILMEASKAIQDLNALTQNATTTDEKIKMVAQSALDFGQKMGISAQTAVGQFKAVEKAAAELQARMAELQAMKMPLPALGPLEQQMMNVQPVFPGAAGANVSPEMWKETNVQIREMQAGMAQVNKEGEQIAVAMEKSAAATSGLNVQIKSAAENMAVLKAFVEGQKGQGILQNFLGSYNAASTVSGQVSAIRGTILQLSKETGASFQQVGTMLRDSFNIPNLQVTNAIKELNDELGIVPEKSRSAVRSIDALRIALGAIVAMLVFQAVQAVTNFFSTAVKSAREYEGVLYNIQNAERIMSQQGVEIAPKDMKEMIDNLRQLVPMLSQVDATKAVGNLALFTKDLGYTKDQIGALADAVGVLYVRNRSLGLSFEQVQSQVQTGLLTGRAQGIRDLGVSISESQIQNEALRMGLVKTDKEFQALTGDVQTQVKAQAMLGLIMRSTAEEQKNLAQYMNTTDAQVGKLTATWSDFTLQAGNFLSPFLNILARFGIALLGVIKSFQQWDINFQAHIIAPFFVFQQMSQGHIKSIGDLKTAYDDAVKGITGGLNQLLNPIEKLSTAQDTATGSAQKLEQSLVDMSKVDLSSLSNALQSLQDRLHDLNRDFAQKNANYQDEFNTKLERMQEDYQLSVSQTQQEFANRRADAEAQYRNQQLDAEAKYQEQLRELRTKYLYDLEDALRNRDARQVLRLQAQYKMDKDNLQHNFEIENAARARQYALELAQLQRQEAQKLAELAQAEAIKEARAREDFAREQAQRKQEYQNQLDDLKRSWDEKLTEEAGKIAADQGLNEEGALAIKKILEKYYGPGGVFDGLFQGSLDSLTTNGAAMLSEMAAIIAQYQAMATTIAPIPFGTSPQSPSPMSPESPFYSLTTPFGGTSPQSPSPMSPTSPFYQYAEGGIDFADRPKTVTFGDRGPEFAAFLPAGKSLKDVPNNLPPSMMGGGLNGLIRLALDLSPDLEARIMDNTLKEAAQISTHVYRRRT